LVKGKEKGLSYIHSIIKNYLNELNKLKLDSKYGEYYMKK